MRRLDKPMLLNKRFGIEIKDGGFRVNCEKCGRGIGGSFSIGKRGGVWLILDGIFHHVDWNRENNSFENILVVCYNCHSKIHEFKYYEPKLIDYEKARADIHKIAGLLD